MRQKEPQYSQTWRMIFCLHFEKIFSMCLKVIWNELPELENPGSILPGKLKKDHLC